MFDCDSCENHNFLIFRLILKAHGDNPGKTTRVAVAVVDTFVWQALASVIIPGFTINRVCAASLHLLGRTTKWPLPVRKWTTTAIGLSTIPFIITPIDRLAQVYLFLCVHVDYVLFIVNKSHYNVSKYSLKTHKRATLLHWVTCSLITMNTRVLICRWK